MALSTSNSNDRLPAGPWRATWLLALFLVAGYMLFVLHAPWAIFEDPTSLENRLQEIETQSLARSACPKIVVLGSSRAAFSIHPGLLDAELALPARSTVNAGYPGMGPSLFPKIWRRNPQLSKASLILLCIDDSFFLTGIPTTPKPAEEIKDTPAERMEHWLRSKALARTKWATRTAWLRHHVLVKVGLKQRLGLHTWDVDDQGFWRWQWLESNKDLQDPARVKLVTESVSKTYYENQQVNPPDVQVFEEFCRHVQTQGLNVVLVRVPPLPAFARLVEQKYGELHNQVKNTFQSLAKRRNIRCYYFERAKECDISDEHYADSVHLTVDGAQRFTRFLARLIRSDGWLPHSLSQFTKTQNGGS